MSTTAQPRGGPAASARERFGARTGLIVSLVTAAAVVYLALDGGGYGAVERSAFGIVVWALVLGMVVLSRGPQRAVPRAAFVIGTPLLAFALVTGLSVFWSQSAGRSFDELARVLVYVGVFVLAVLAVRASGPRAVVDGLVAGTGLVALLAVLSRLEPTFFPAQEYQRLDPESSARLTFPLNYWNGLAAFLALALALLLYQATRDDVSARLRALGAALLPVAGLGLYLTFSRGGAATALLACALTLALSPRRVAVAYFLAVAAAGTAVLVAITRSYRALNDGLIETDAARSQGHKVLVALVLVAAAAYGAWFLRERLALLLPAGVREMRMPRRGLLVGAGILLGAGAIAIALGAGSIERRWESFKDPVVFQGNVSTDSIESRFLSGSGNGRYQYWSASIDAFESKPFGGIGAGTWDYWWRRNATSGGAVRDSHSLFADVIAELGVFGTVSLVAMFAIVLAVGLGAWRRAQGADRLLGTALLVVVCTFTFHAAIDWIWELPAIGVLYFAAAGVLAWLAPGGALVSARRAATAGIAVACLAWVAMFAEAIPLLSNWKINQSQAAAREGNLDGALKSASTAHTIEPWAGEPLLQIAQVRELINPDAEAINAAGDAVRSEPANWETWFVLARIEAKAGQREAAERHLAAAKRLNPLSPIWQQIDGVDALAGG